MKIKKRLNKKGVLAISQIFILIISIIAFSFIISLNSGVVSAYNDGETYESWTRNNGKWTSNTAGFEKEIKTDVDIKGFQDTAAKLGETAGSTGTSTATAGVTSLPTQASHGYAGRAIEAVFGPGSTAPAGKYISATGKTLTSQGIGFSASGIVQGAIWAVVVYGVVKMAGGLFGLDDAKTEAAATAAAWGMFAGKAALALFSKGGYLAGTWQSLFGATLGTAGATGIGLVVAVIVFIMLYSDTETQVVEFTCSPWDARTGGSDCEKCNKQGLLPCSEYQCRSLGQSCQLLNPGTGEEKCAWVNKNDVNPPVITPDKKALLDGYSYNPDNTISPPDRGVFIINGNSKEKCAKAFTRLTFGITLDEPAKCKLDYSRKDSFDEMDYYFGGSPLLRYNHTQIMSLPGVDNLAQENITLKNNGEFELYTRCQDSNGNSNTANYVFKLCVEKGPDTTPPLIAATNLINDMPIAYDQSSVDLEVYINEPAECKWSHLDQGYDDMEETMSCSSSITEINAQALYTCQTTLTGLKNNFENKFYFRCKDQPLKTQDRNVNVESYKFTLLGTQPLVIDSVEPNGTIKDSTDTVKVTLEAETSAGYKEGEAICYYSISGEDNYISFYETSSYKHSQDLWLPEGNYKYSIKCIDLGGNADTKEVNFNIESDTDAPVIVRAYHDDETYLRLRTNEEAECVYDVVNCNYLFQDGTSITTTNGLDHFADWDTKTNFYIKCRDEYGNDPQPSNICSIEVRAFEIF